MFCGNHFGIHSVKLHRMGSTIGKKEKKGGLEGEKKSKQDFFSGLNAPDKNAIFSRHLPVRNM